MQKNREIFVPEGGPPQYRPNPEIYAQMREENIYKMLEDFYILLGKSKIKDLFPKDVVKASKKSAAFFVFLLGGPPLYQQHYGSPMMRQRHLPFVIDEAAKQEWLRCFAVTLVDAEVKYHFPIKYLEEFRLFLEHFSSWMVNTKTHKEGCPHHNDQ